MFLLLSQSHAIVVVVIVVAALLKVYVSVHPSIRPYIRPSLDPSTQSHLTLSLRSVSVIHFVKLLLLLTDEATRSTQSWAIIQ